MPQTGISRRQLSGLALLPLIGAIAGVSEASADQPHMRKALAALQTALAELQTATPNKKGHRKEAMRLIQAAIAEVNRGIQASGS